MRVAVTGATGYLGSRLCAALLREGYDVRVLVRRSSRLDALPDGGSSVEIAYGDVTDPASLAAAFDGCEAVFHVAAAVSPWLPDPSVFFEVNVRGLENVLDAVKVTTSVKKIIYTSSFFALGPTDGGIGDETTIHEGNTVCTEYERSKVFADRIALKEAKKGVPIVILYPGVIYGPGLLTTGNFVTAVLIERFNGRLPGYVGNGDDRHSFCHVEDVAEAHIAALNKGRVGERYVLTGEIASFAQLFDLAAAITKTSKPIFHIPLWLVYIYGWMSVLVSRLTGKLPLISYPAVDVLRHKWEYSCDKARAELRYNPRSLRDGLTDTLLWLKTIKAIKF